MDFGFILLIDEHLPQFSNHTFLLLLSAQSQPTKTNDTINLLKSYQSTISNLLYEIKLYHDNMYILKKDQNVLKSIGIETLINVLKMMVG